MTFSSLTAVWENDISDMNNNFNIHYDVDIHNIVIISIIFIVILTETTFY